MCGRYDLSETGRTLRIGGFEVILATVPPRYNVSPLQTVPVIRRRQVELFVSDLRWGLVPRWSRDASMAARCINARAETVAQKPMFRSAFERRRCVVPADGYYEWQKAGRLRLPWRFVRRDGQPLLFAGVWESWKPPADPEGPGLQTFSILTTTANGMASEVHDRMPVLLDPSGAVGWLDPAAVPGDLLGLCAPPANELLNRYRVSTVVNNSRNDTPECIQSAKGDELPLPPSEPREPE